MSEDRQAARSRQSFEELNLHRRIGDMILTTDDVCDFEFDVVHDRRQSVKIAGVLTHEHWIRQGGAVDMAFAAHEILPPRNGVVELEAPVRSPALSFEARAVFRTQSQSGTVINRRQAARLLAPAAAVKLLR